MSTRLLRTSRYGKPLAALLISLAGALWAGDRWSAAAQDTNTYIELERPRTDLTGLADESTVVPVDLVTPEAARNIGPGSALIITIPDEGRFGCTANFVWASGENLYLGAAGHCFLPETRKATHGAGAD